MAGFWNLGIQRVFFGARPCHVSYSITAAWWKICVCKLEEVKHCEFLRVCLRTEAREFGDVNSGMRFSGLNVLQSKTIWRESESLQKNNTYRSMNDVLGETRVRFCQTCCPKSRLVLRERERERVKSFKLPVVRWGEAGMRVFGVWTPAAPNEDSVLEKRSEGLSSARSLAVTVSCVGKGVDRISRLAHAFTVSRLCYQ